MARLPPADNVSDLLSRAGLDQNQINQLTALKNSTLLTADEEGRNLLFNVIGWIKNPAHGFQETIDYLTSVQNMDKRNIIFESPVNKQIRDQFEEEIDAYVYKPKQSEGIYICPKCKSGKVNIQALQTRSADESMTLFADCVCGHHFKPSN